MGDSFARWFRRTFNIYGSMVCDDCGYRVPFLGDRSDQLDRDFAHYQALHEADHIRAIDEYRRKCAAAIGEALDRALDEWDERNDHG